MKIAVLSGKGGTGKTFISVNLAAAVKDAVYIDCDVEEPDGHIFFKPENVEKYPVNVYLPDFNNDKCTGCRKCVDFCRFNALVYVKGSVRVLPEICHHCGGCVIVCPSKAVSEREHNVGTVECGTHNNISVITGTMNLGEESGVPIIKAAIEKGDKENKFTIIDCPPGSNCTAMESINNADYCIIVAEPTSFGFHNFCMIYELVTVMGKQFSIIINKSDESYPPLMEFINKNNLNLLTEIKYNPVLAECISKGNIAVEENIDILAVFEELIKKIGGDIS